MTQLERLKAKIKEKLGELECVIGWEAGYDPLRATPLFARTPEQADRLVVGPTCVQNLAVQLPALRKKKVGVVVKGCDSRSVVQLLQEKLIDRDSVVVFGLPCQGVIDAVKVAEAVDADAVEAVTANGDELVLTVSGQTVKLKPEAWLADKCLRCRHPNPVIADETIGEPVQARAQADDYPDVAAFDALTAKERFDFWRTEMDRCLRCYACRNACPQCVCRDHCVAESREPRWVSQAASVKDKWMFQVIHALHMAGRCTECGECERACPVNLPILKLKRKLNREVKELFNYEAGMDPSAVPPLFAFKTEEDTIKEREL